jgi:hypothetical protein
VFFISGKFDSSFANIRLFFLLASAPLTQNELLYHPSKKTQTKNSYIKTSTGGLKCSMPSGAEALAADEARMETDAAAGRGRGDAAGSSGARSRSRSRTTKAKAIRILPSKAGKKRKHPLNKHTARGW